MPETLFWWIFLLACIFAIFFGYGMVEGLIRKWVSIGGSKKEWVEKLHDNPDPRETGTQIPLLH